MTTDHRPRSDQPSGPLAGIRVVEIASIVLGPLATQYLGDMGADVIKIEPPDGDLTRSLGPQRNPGMSSVFLNCNRNKRSVVLDARKPAEQRAIQALVSNADVLVHSVRAPAAQRMGITWDALSAVNPKLVYCHVKGFLDGGRYSGRPAYDDVIQALSGLVDLQGQIVGEPRLLPTILADKVSGLHAAFAVGMALFHRAVTGRGQCVSVPMFESITAFNCIEHLWGATFDPPIAGVGYEMITKSVRRPHATKDGYIVFLPYTDAHWRRFFEIIGQPELMGEERFSSYGARQRNAQAVWQFVGEQLKARTSSEWLQLFQDGNGDVPIAAVNTFEQVIHDTHLDSVGFWELVDHPTEGRLRMPSVPFEFSDSAASIRRPAPGLGEHTSEVLREFGISLEK